MTQIEIPTELPGILRNFTLSVLRTRPHDILDHAVDYFLDLQRQRQWQLTAGNNNNNSSSSMAATVSSPLSPSSSIRHQEQQLQTVKHNAATPDDTSMAAKKKAAAGEEASIINSAPPSINYTLPVSSSEETASSEEGDVVGTDEAMRCCYVKKNEYRRISVAAERYNPEEDDDSDDGQSQTYPKTSEQRQRLKDAVCHNLLFRTLEAKQIDQILDAMWEKHVPKGESIIRQGDDGDHFYIIDQGVYDVYVSPEKASNGSLTKIGAYDQCGSFGELALMYNQPRSATIVAHTDGILWVMGRQTFRKLVLKHAFRKRQMYENFLRELSILKSLTDYERSNVADALLPSDYYQNDVIIRQGEQADRMFFIEDGQCDVYMNEKFHKRLSKGDYFGELALLNHEPRSATVIAASYKVRLASLEVQSFERLLGPCMDLLHRYTSNYTK